MYILKQKKGNPILFDFALLLKQQRPASEQLEQEHQQQHQFNTCGDMYIYIYIYICMCEKIRMNYNRLSSIFKLILNDFY